MLENTTLEQALSQLKAKDKLPYATLINSVYPKEPVERETHKRKITNSIS